MLSFLRGVVVDKWGGEVLVDAGGLGFLVKVPVSLFCRAERGKGVTLWIKSVFKERDGGFVHYGFSSREELELFEMLLKVPSVGPQVAMALISHLGVDGFWRAVETGDAEALKRAPKVGDRTARRIVSELSRPSEVRASSTVEGVVEALVSLGYTRQEALKAVSSVGASGDETEEELLRRALRILGEGI